MAQAITPAAELAALHLPESVFDEVAPIASDHMYTLLQSPKDKSLDDLTKMPDMPILVFTGNLYREVLYITEKLHNSEFALFLLLQRIENSKPHFLAFDFVIPAQEASGGGVSLDGDDCRKHFDALAKNAYYSTNGLHRHLAHLHSHAGFECFWSSIDDNQQLSYEGLGFMDDYRFYVVVNAKGNIKASYVQYKPVLFRTDCAVALSFAEPEHSEWLSKERKLELDALIAAQVTPGYASVVSEHSVGTFVGDIVANKSTFPGTTTTSLSSLGSWGSFGSDTWANAKTQYDDNDITLQEFARYLTKYTPRYCGEIAKEALQEFTEAAHIAPDSKIARTLLSWLIDAVVTAVDLQCYDDLGYPLGEYVNEVLAITHGEILEAHDLEFVGEATYLAMRSKSGRAYDCMLSDVQGMVADMHANEMVQ